jgi:hypothetical protein
LIIINKHKTVIFLFCLYRSAPSEQQDLDLTRESLTEINQRLNNSSTPNRSASLSVIKTSKLPITQPYPSIKTYQEPIIADSRSRQNISLTSTTNKMYLIPQSNSHSQHLDPINNNTQKSSTERGRTFVHHADSRPFVLGTAIQMKPMENLLLSNEKRRPCHRQNALRFKVNEPERPSRISTPIRTNNNLVITNISRYQSIERRLTSSPQAPMKSLSFDINHEFHPSDISWSVREKAKLFEHTNQHKLSTGRENYV